MSATSTADTSAGLTQVGLSLGQLINNGKNCVSLPNVRQGCVTPYAMMHIVVPYNSFAFDSTFYLQLPKSLDHLLQMWFRITMPALVANGGTYAYYTNFIAARMIKEVQLQVSNLNFSGTVPYWAYDFYDECMFAPGRKFGIYGGKRETVTQLKQDALDKRIYYLKLIFSNCLFVNQSIPVAAGLLSTYQLAVTTSPTSVLTVYDGSAPTLSATNVSIDLLVSGLLMSTEERNLMQTSKHQKIFLQNQSIGPTRVDSNQGTLSAVRIPLTYRLPIRQMFWAELASSNEAQGVNNWLAWGNQVQSVSVITNNQQRTPTLPRPAFETVLQHDAGSGYSNKHISVYSFQLSMTSGATTQTYNFDQQTDSALLLFMGQTNTIFNMYMLAINFNVMLATRNALFPRYGGVM